MKANVQIDQLSAQISEEQGTPLNRAQKRAVKRFAKHKIVIRPKMDDPLSWVINGMKPILAADVEVAKLRENNNAALEAVRTGRATIAHADVLLGALNMAEALAQLGQGTDWLPEIASAQKALVDAGERKKFLFTGPEMTAVYLAMDVHEAQLDSPKTTIALVEEALRIVKKVIALKKAKPIRFEPA